MTTSYTLLESPIGPLTLTSDGTCLTGVYMADQRHGPIIASGWTRDDNASPLPEAARQLTAYFRGERRAFDLPMRLSGTVFQKRVWEELASIPYGETISYGQLASRVGKPGAFRAVGQANGKNPISLIIPCHRVIASGGKLGGYGGGLDRKKVLLALEQSAG